ncbi:MAG: hypothetical protein FJ278_16415 [Planctomycetes bacterium]|nr:hypothetical protein [Planctomycetota bacterium]
MDRVLEAAEASSVPLMVCFGTYGELRQTQGFFNEQAWQANPYNAALGGPCASPDDFWTNETALKLYKQRLRYIVARWGYSPNVMAWEFWNEARPPADWTREMAQHLRRLDPFSHLISTTYGDHETWLIDEIDFTQTHKYGDTGNIRDLADTLSGDCIDHTTKFWKPHLVSEFGIDWRTSDEKYDPKGEGVNLHSGLWASALARGAGSAMLWYWDYVDSKNLYPHFTALAKFAKDVPWASRQFDLATTTSPTISDGPETLGDLRIPCYSGWGKPRSEAYVVGQDGKVEGWPVAQFLFAPVADKEAMRSVPTFRVRYPKPGKFIVHVNSVSTRGQLQIRLDDRVVLDKELLTGPEGQGPWKKSQFREQWSSYQCLYDQDFEIPVPAGEHEIQLENMNGDWISLDHIVLTPYRSSKYPDVRVLGLQDVSSALLWIQDKEFNWHSRSIGKEPRTLAGVSFDLLGLQDGSYRLEWWDTYTGTVLKADETRCADAKLTVVVPKFSRDVACKVKMGP